MQRDLTELRWTPGPFREFTIYEKKPRIIRAAPYRDRVVHQAIIQNLEAHFDSALIHDSYACRKGKGTHAAVDRAQHFLRGNSFFLHLDVVKYFPSIPHGPLKALLRRKLSDIALLQVLDSIIDHQGDPFPDDLVELAERKGLPIGSLTSQWFANLYLDPVDRLIKQQLQVPAYVRYMDDLVLFARSKEDLRDWYDQIACFTKTHLELMFHHERAHPTPTRHGLSFLGFRLFPSHRRLLPPSGYRFRRRMAATLRAIDRGEATAAVLAQRASGWLGHAARANTVVLRRVLRGSLLAGRRPGVPTA